MPREQIELPQSVERLSILDEDGNLDHELEPELEQEQLLRMHKTMLQARRFDERLLRLQRQGSIGTFAPVKGQEAAQIGAICGLETEDWFVPAFRETAAMLWRGASMEQIIVFNAGFNEGGAIPEESHDLPIAVPVGSQIPHAAGIGYAIRLRGEEQVVMVFFGDGATSEGDFHEGLNFAGVSQAPVVFLCQNNGWAISIPREEQTASKTLAQKGLAYGIPGIQVDGNDVLAMEVAAREAVNRARGGGGPTLIEAVTYRLEVHTTADDPTRYRDDEEVRVWQERDPISRFQDYLKEKELLDDDTIDSLEQEIEDAIDDAWSGARKTIASLGDPVVMFDHVFAELPYDLAQQKEVLKAARDEGLLGDSDHDDGDQDDGEDPGDETGGDQPAKGGEDEEDPVDG